MRSASRPPSPPLSPRWPGDPSPHAAPRPRSPHDPPPPAGAARGAAGAGAVRQRLRRRRPAGHARAPGPHRPQHRQPVQRRVPRRRRRVHPRRVRHPAAAGQVPQAQGRHRRRPARPDPRQHRLEIAVDDHPGRAARRDRGASPCSRCSTSTGTSPTPSRSRSRASSGGGSTRYDIDGDGEFDATRTSSPPTSSSIPAGQDVNLEISSNDVIHSFWIPALNGKKDAVPGRTHPLRAQGRRARRLRRPVHRVLRPVPRQHAHARRRHRPADDFDAWARGPDRPEADVPHRGEAARPAAAAVRHPVLRLPPDPRRQRRRVREQGDGAELLVSGNAPDLTHFASRGTFAGGIFDLWIDQRRRRHRRGRRDRRRVQLRRPSRPGCATRRPRSPWTPPRCPSPAASRGMPDLDLPEEQIDQLVAYLETLE